MTLERFAQSIPLVALFTFALALLSATLPLLLSAANLGEGSVKLGMSLANSFAAGVLFSGGLVHLLPEALETLAGMSSLPIASLLAGAGFVVVLTVEEGVTAISSRARPHLIACTVAQPHDAERHRKACTIRRGTSQRATLCIPIALSECADCVLANRGATDRPDCVQSPLLPACTVDIDVNCEPEDTSVSSSKGSAKRAISERMVESQAAEARNAGTLLF
jgi:hypothetical protein